MIWVRCSFLLLLLLLPLASFADESVDAMKEIDAANAAYDKGEFNDALVHYRKAFLITDDARLLYRIGITFENLANYQRAREHLELYLLSEPNSKYAGRVKKKVENLRKLEKTLQSAVRLESNPTRADVYVDDPNQPVGETPIRLPVGPGSHTFTLKKNGFEELSVSVDVPSGETVEYTAEMFLKDEIVEEPEKPLVVKKPKIAVEEKPKEPEESIYDGTLTRVDVAPPAVVRVLLWSAFPIGAALGIVGLVFTSIDRAGGVPLMLVGATVSATSGYFLWIHNWTSTLPNVEADTPPTAGIGIRF